MKTVKTIIGLLAVLATSTSYVFAQESVGTVKPTASPDLLSSIENCVGEKFVFLPQPKSAQKNPYLFFAFSNGRTAKSEFDYSNTVGKIIVAKKLEAGIRRQVVFEFEGTSNSFSAEVRSGQIEAIAAVRELELARERWLNKTIYPRKRMINTYDSETGRYGDIPVFIGEPLKVTSVQWGNNSSRPVWLVVRRINNDVGFISTAVLWINKSNDRQSSEAPWKENFSDEDPRKLNKWSDADWKNIEKGLITVGMTSDQVRWAWGDPPKTTSAVTEAGTQETWIYARQKQTLLFRNDTLKVISDL